DRDGDAGGGRLYRRGTVGDGEGRGVGPGRVVGVAGILQRAGRGPVAEVPTVGVGRRAAAGRAGKRHAKRRVARRRRGGGGGRQRGGALDPEVFEGVAKGRLVGGGHRERGQADGVVGVDDARVHVVHHPFHRGQHVGRGVRDVGGVVLLHVGRRGHHDGRHPVGVADVIRAVT